MTSRPRQLPTRPPDDGNQRIPEMSGRGAILALILLFVFLYAVRWALLPFVLAAVGAYICAPMVQWLANRTGLPRLLFVCATVIALLAAGAAIAALGGPARPQPTFRGLHPAHVVRGGPSTCSTPQHRQTRGTASG